MKWKIGDLARLASCSTAAIRFYEKKGLLESPDRSGSNYRLYGEKDMERLRFIIHCRNHGISLEEIARLLAFRKNPGADCNYVHALIGRHLATVEAKIESLTELKRELEALVRESGCARGASCSILRSLEANDGCPYCRYLDNAGEEQE